MTNARLQKAKIAEMLTRLLPAFRTVGAAFAVVASCAWIPEILLDQPNVIVDGIEQIVHHGMSLSAALWVLSLLAWLIQRQSSLVQRNSKPMYESAD